MEKWATGKLGNGIMRNRKKGNIYVTTEKTATGNLGSH